MSLHSMTAFARCEKRDDQGELVWELRSVNHRYLELFVRLPEELRGIEAAVRERVGERHHLDAGFPVGQRREVGLDGAERAGRRRRHLDASAGPGDAGAHPLEELEEAADAGGARLLGNHALVLGKAPAAVDPVPLADGVERIDNQVYVVNATGLASKHPK